MAERPKFATEIAVFEQHRLEWAKTHAGKYVLIRDTDFGGFFTEYAEALREGLRRFGAEREFLIKQVGLSDPVYVVS